MFSEANLSTLIIAVVAMAILTALSRALPFLLPDNSPIIRFFTAENSPLAPLGGAIIMAMTVVLMLPFFGIGDGGDNDAQPLLAVLSGIIATIIATVRGINTGFCVIIGMLGFLVGTLMQAYMG